LWKFIHPRQKDTISAICSLDWGLAGPLRQAYHPGKWKEFIMKLWPDMASITKILFASLAVAGLPSIASADTDGTAAATTPALKCLLTHEHNGCADVFVGRAGLAARPWVWFTPNQDFALGALVSSRYAGTETQTDAYIAKFLNGRTADLYDVKFAHQEKTFYIAPPDPDGKIRYVLVRDGAPDAEKDYLFLHGPG
jgi:hypothetical protein